MRKTATATLLLATLLAAVTDSQSMTSATAATSAKRVISVADAQTCSSVAKGLPYAKAAGTALSTDARFTASTVWWFGDSISARCSWEFASSALSANGYRCAFNVVAGARSTDKIAEAIAVGQRTRTAPRVIVWQFGANDSIDANGPSKLTGTLTRLRTAYPHARIVWVNVYRGLTKQTVYGNTVNALATSNRFNAYVTPRLATLRIEPVNWAAQAHRNRGQIMMRDLTHPTISGTTSRNGAKQFVNLVVGRIVTPATVPA